MVCGQMTSGIIDSSADVVEPGIAQRTVSAFDVIVVVREVAVSGEHKRSLCSANTGRSTWDPRIICLAADCYIISIAHRGTKPQLPVFVQPVVFPDGLLLGGPAQPNGRITVLSDARGCRRKNHTTASLCRGVPPLGRARCDRPP